MEKLLQTPSQTLGPYFAYGLTPEQYQYGHNSIVDNHLFKNSDLEGECILLRGQVLDGEGNPIDDAMLEIRQDNTFDGFGRMGTGTEPDNAFIFHTVKPQTAEDVVPYIDVVVMMRGLLSHVYTRIYFEDEPNEKDPVFAKLPNDRKKTLLARRSQQKGMICYTFDIHMQGENETIFFDA